MPNLVTDFIWNDAALERLLTGPSGPVAVDMSQRMIRATNAAKVNASGRPGPNVRTGRLRGSISWRLGTDEQGLYGEYGSAVPYAYPLETGLRNGRKYPFLVPAIPAATG